MTDEKRKLEPPLYIDMSPDELLERLLQTDPAEVEPATGKKSKVVKAARRLPRLNSSPSPQKAREE
jgi:hypothetical protein